MVVLVVEDEPGITDFLRRGFEAAGFAVVVEADGHQGLLSAQREDIDLMVLDLGLPDIDGLEVLRRAREQGVQVPVIVVTASTGGDDRAQARALGVDDYLVKPFPMNQLLASLDRLDPGLKEAAVSS